MDGYTRYGIRGMWNRGEIHILNGSMPRFMERRKEATNTEVGRISFFRPVRNDRTEFSIRKLIPPIAKKKVPLSIVAVPRDGEGLLLYHESVILYKWHLSGLGLIANPTLAYITQDFVYKAMRGGSITDSELLNDGYATVKENLL